MIAEMETGTIKRVMGGSFLLEDLAPQDIFTVEDLSPEQVQIAAMTHQFAEEKILTQVDAIENKQYEVSRELMRELGDLGLLSVDVPEEYGGLDLEKVTSALVSQNISVLGSFAVTFSAHVSIGSLPLIWYGTAEQKEKYLPRLASGEWIAAYALSESSAGSDAMNIRAKATLSDDGQHYLLNGEKMWISNAGFADLFTIFAKIDGEKFSAFLVEKGTEGLTVGAEEHKLGIRGSSTCPLILNNCKVPVGNLLGQAGKGHQIAFNILNVGRYKLAAIAAGECRFALRDGIRYAKDRVGFNKPVTEFGLVQEKIADCASSIYALEAAVYRVIGSIDVALAELDKRSPTYTQEVQKRIEEFAMECSILKFYGSEVLDRLVSQVLQMHGGYGYVEEFPAERHYRDSRINMIFEGTNEINRLITTGWLMKRAGAGTLPLSEAIQELMAELSSGSASIASGTGPMSDVRELVARAKKTALFCTGLASQRFAPKELAEQQEITGALSDIFAEVLVLESALLRTEKMAGANPLAETLCRYYAGARSLHVIHRAADRVLGAVAEGDALQKHAATLRELLRCEPANTVALGREISRATVRAGQYTSQA